MSLIKLTNINKCIELDVKSVHVSVTVIVLGTYILLYDCSSCSTHLCDLDLYVMVD